MFSSFAPAQIIYLNPSNLHFVWSQMNLEAIFLILFVWNIDMGVYTLFEVKWI